jgi:hypothetical protein
MFELYHIFEWPSRYLYDLLLENGVSATMRSFIICVHPKILLGRSSQRELGGRGIWHAWERRESVQSFDEKSEDQIADRRMESEWILGRLAWGGGVEWIQMAENRDQWRALVNAVMNQRVLASLI